MRCAQMFLVKLDNARRVPDSHIIVLVVYLICMGARKGG